MRPTYSNVINQRFRAKKGRTEEVMGIVIPLKVYYALPKKLPWEPQDPNVIPNKYVEFAYSYNGSVLTDRYSWYKFFNTFERID